MKRNLVIDILASLPIILIALYFSRFLGIVLILLRYYHSSSRKKNLTPIVLIFVGLIVLIPKGLDIFFDTINFDYKDIPLLSDIITSSTYNGSFMKYSKALIIIGIVFAIINYFLDRLVRKVKNYINTGVNNYTNKQLENEKENDLKIKEQQERAKNTKVVTCKKCGATNIITGSIGKCKYCRSTLIGK